MKTIKLKLTFECSNLIRRFPKAKNTLVTLFSVIEIDINNNNMNENNMVVV